VSNPQPTPLQVPVTVQGATPVEGTDRRELFTETTKTTLTFENGAVVSLKAKVSPGQCLFLRNELSGREILCKVLEYRPGGPGGYTDLEFTSRDPGFWNAPAAKPAAEALGTRARESEAAAAVRAAVEKLAATSTIESSAPPVAEIPAAISEAPNAAPVIPQVPATQPAPAHENEADWNDAKEAELVAALALMAGEAKPKPKPESAADAAEARAKKVASEGASQDESGSEVAAQSKVSSLLASFTGTMRDFKPGKVSMPVGIAAAVLIVAALGFAWHAKRAFSRRASNHSDAVSAQPAPHVQPLSSQPSPTPAATAATSATATSAAASPAATLPANAATAAPANGTPTAANIKAPPPSAAPAPANSASKVANNYADGTATLAQARHHKSKDPSVGETIPAKILSQAPPAIPSWAKKLDLDPVVRLDAVIDEKGNLKATKPLSGPRILQGEAARAVALWIFQPAMTDGKPTTTHMVLTVEFQR
jgi:hypothetical protein